MSGPPDAIPPDTLTVCRVRDVITVLLVAVAVLAVADSQGLVTWARDLPPNPVNDALRLLVYGWHVLMERFGAVEVFQVLRDTFRTLRAGG